MPADEGLGRRLVMLERGPDGLGPIGNRRALQSSRLWAGLAAALAALLLLPGRAGHGGEISGTVVDARTGAPIAGAIVSAEGTISRTDETGAFHLPDAARRIGIRAFGYWPRQWSSLDRPDIALEPVLPRAVHLSMSALRDPMLREAVVGLASTTQVNALVIDVKDEQGALALRQPEELGSPEGQGETADLRALIDRLHRDRIYAIARIVVFKDGALAQAHPELALTAADGSAVREADGIPWVDPRNRAVWTYNLAIATEAARLGFDEIQLDYVRFPTVAFAMQVAIDPSQDRRETIRGFLREARAALSPYNVFLAADVFGYASWDPSDTNIGQNLEDIAGEVDYICLMLYPSAFKTGLPGSRMPLDHLGEIVEQSLRHAQQRTGLAAIRFRPWLQAFPDFNFDRRPFKRAEITAQTRAADGFGADGWMLWHTHSIYAEEDLP
jgi:hypothetical protein